MKQTYLSERIPYLSQAFNCSSQHFQVCTCCIYWKQMLKVFNKANSRALVANKTMAFRNCYPKHPNKAFLVPNLGTLVFARNFAITQIGGR